MLSKYILVSCMGIEDNVLYFLSLWMCAQGYSSCLNVRSILKIPKFSILMHFSVYIGMRKSVFFYDSLVEDICLGLKHDNVCLMTMYLSIL